MKNFKEKIVVITGAGSGMGREYAKEFAKRDSYLALNDFDEKGLQETLKILQERGYSKNITTAVFDVSSREAMHGFAGKVKKQLGAAHIIINNAGIQGKSEPIWHIDQKAFDRIMDINFWGVVYGTQEFLSQILTQKEGAIVNISSMFAFTGMPNNADYCASKFAVRGFTEALMVELQDSPIQVHVVHPGAIKTNINKDEKSKEIAEKYLTTPPENVVRDVIKAIEKNKPRITTGRDSFRVWFISHFLPTKLINKLVWRELKPQMPHIDYHDAVKK